MRNPQQNRARFATAPDGRIPRVGSLIGNATQAVRLTGQNPRGLQHLVLEKAAEFVKKRRLLVTCLMETLQVSFNKFNTEASHCMSEEAWIK